MKILFHLYSCKKHNLDQKINVDKSKNDHNSSPIETNTGKERFIKFWNQYSNKNLQNNSASESSNKYIYVSHFLEAFNERFFLLAYFISNILSYQVFCILKMNKFTSILIAIICLLFNLFCIYILFETKFALILLSVLVIIFVIICMKIRKIYPRFLISMCLVQSFEGISMINLTIINSCLVLYLCKFTYLLDNLTYLGILIGIIIILISFSSYKKWA